MGLIVVGYHLFGGEIIRWFMEMVVVPTVNPVHGSELDLGFPNFLRVM